MMTIDWIIKAIRGGRIRITDHADEEAQSDRISFDQIFSSVFRGEIIETYPDDKPYPSCLICGQTYGRDSIHSVWGYNPDTDWAVLITVYRPDPDRWIDFKQRRSKRETI
jgi:hypothetical protein